MLPPDASLAIEKVENPSLDPSLEHRLRTKVRDELASRGLVLWEDAAQADARMYLRIHHVLDRARVKDEDDETLKSYVEVQMDSTIRRREDNALLWQSGLIEVQWSYTGLDGSPALDQALDLAVRQLADRMGQAY